MKLSEVFGHQNTIFIFKIFSTKTQMKARSLRSYLFGRLVVGVGVEPWVGIGSGQWLFTDRKESILIF